MWAALFLGFSLAALGMDNETGQRRWTFVFVPMMKGFDFLIASMCLGNVVGLIVVLLTLPWFAAILCIPFSIIAPVILVICAVGAYTVHGSMFDVYLMMGLGVLGDVFKKLDYPLAPLVLALVLGSGGSMFVSNPLVASITALALLMLFWPLIGAALGRMKRQAA